MWIIFSTDTGKVKLYLIGSMYGKKRSYMSSIKNWIIHGSVNKPRRLILYGGTWIGSAPSLKLTAKRPLKMHGFGRCNKFPFGPENGWKMQKNLQSQTLAIYIYIFFKSFLLLLSVGAWPVFVVNRWWTLRRGIVCMVRAILLETLVVKVQSPGDPRLYNSIGFCFGGMVISLTFPHVP